jgi:hypothetical protein
MTPDYAVFALFYLLGMLGVDFIFDWNPSPTTQLTYNCTLLDSFTTLIGAIRMLPAGLVIAVGSVRSFLAAKGFPRVLYAVNIIILTCIGAPCFYLTAYSVQKSCVESKNLPGMLLNHLGILAVLLGSISLILKAKNIQKLKQN